MHRHAGSPARKGSRAALGTVASLVVAGALAAPAGATIPPNNGTISGIDGPPIHVVNPFPVRDFVHTAGWLADDRVTINVLRGPNDVEVGTATAVSPFFVPAKGTSPPEWDVDVNHPGAACWEGTTPDILPGDKIRATIVANASEPSRVGLADQVVTQNVTAGPLAETAPGSHVIVVHGTAETQDGRQFPDGELESRLVAKKQAFLINGRRDLRAISGAPTGNEGVIAYDDPGSTTNFAWTAFFDLNDAPTHPNPDPGVDTATALGAESRALWLGRNAAVPNEVTTYEFGQIPGPASPCTAPLARTAITAVDRPFLNAGFFSSGGALTVSGVATPDVTGVDVAAPGGPSRHATPSVGGLWTATIPAADASALPDGPVTVTASFTGGTVPSDTTTVTKDTVAPGAPTAAPGPGRYTTAQAVTLGAPGATIHYTVDGSPPTAANAVYAGQIAVTAPQTIRAVAIDAAGNASDAVSFAYVIDTTPVPAPVATGTIPAGPPLPAGPTIVYIPSPAAAPAAGRTAASAPELAAARVAVASRLSARAVRAHGLRLVVQAPSGAVVVRIALVRVSGGRRTPVATAWRSTDGARTLRVVLAGGSLRALRAGRYRVEVTPGRTRSDTGPTAAATVTVTT